MSKQIHKHECATGQGFGQEFLIVDQKKKNQHTTYSLITITIKHT